MIHANMGNAIRLLWTTTWHAIVVWCLVAPVCAAAIYAGLTPVLRRMVIRKITPE
jgi:phosphate/sulfate permease